MEPIQQILYANLEELGLRPNEPRYYTCGLERYVFSYFDQNGHPRYRKILLNSNDIYGNEEGIRTREWLSFLGVEDYLVLIEPTYQIIDTPHMGVDLYSLTVGKNFWDPLPKAYYTFNGFKDSDIAGWLYELEERLMEFQRLTGHVHVDLFATGRPNNIVWNNFDPRLPTLNVIDYESFQFANDRNLANFYWRWDTAKEYILRNLTGP